SRIQTSASRSPSGVKTREPRTMRSALLPCPTVAGASGSDERAVRIGATVADELPGGANLLDHVEVEVGHDHRVLVPGRFGHDLASGVAEVALAVELAHVPGRLDAHAVDGAHEVAVGHRVS